MTENVSLVKPGRLVGVIGAGVMGQTLIKGLLSAGLITRDQIWAADRSADTRDAVARDIGIAVYDDYRAAMPRTDVVLVCVKPKQIATAMASAHDAAPAPGTLFISILAGVTAPIRARESAVLPSTPSQPQISFKAAPSDEDFRGSGVAKEGRRARRQAIGPRLEDNDEIADLGVRQVVLNPAAALRQGLGMRVELADL